MTLSIELLTFALGEVCAQQGKRSRLWQMSLRKNNMCTSQRTDWDWGKLIIRFSRVQWRDSATKSIWMMSTWKQLLVTSKSILRKCKNQRTVPMLLFTKMKSSSSRKNDTMSRTYWDSDFSVLSTWVHRTKRLKCGIYWIPSWKILSQKPTLKFSSTNCAMLLLTWTLVRNTQKI